MSDLKDLELLFQSRVPLIVIQTHEEMRVMDMLKRLILSLNKPLFSWTITQGLSRADLDMGSQRDLNEATAVLRHIKATSIGGVYVLLDFHPYMEEPVNAR